MDIHEFGSKCPWYDLYSYREYISDLSLIQAFSQMPSQPFLQLFLQTWHLDDYLPQKQQFVYLEVVLQQVLNLQPYPINQGQPKYIHPLRINLCGIFLNILGTFNRTIINIVKVLPNLLQLAKARDNRPHFSEKKSRCSVADSPLIHPARLNMSPGCFPYFFCKRK